MIFINFIKRIFHINIYIYIDRIIIEIGQVIRPRRKTWWARILSFWLFLYKWHTTIYLELSNWIWSTFNIMEWNGVHFNGRDSFIQSLLQCIFSYAESECTVEWKGIARKKLLFKEVAKEILAIWSFFQCIIIYQLHFIICEFFYCKM